MKTKCYQIDEVAKITGMTKRCIRYYEDMELIKPARTETSYRLYTENDIETIKEIRDLKTKMGLNLAEIQHFLGLRKTVQDIGDGTIKDIAIIKEAELKTRELMRLMEEKEKIMTRIKNNYQNDLLTLNVTISELEKR